MGNIVVNNLMLGGDICAFGPSIVVSSNAFRIILLEIICD